jgi:hypothetical protein
MESGRGSDLVDDDEEYGNTPRRGICDNSRAEGRCSVKGATRGTDPDPAECQFFMGR